MNNNIYLFPLNTKKLTYLFVFLFLTTYSFSQTSQQADIDTLYKRVYDSTLSIGFSTSNIVKDLSKFNGTGRFTDVNYLDTANCIEYSPQTHQDRTLEMAIAYQTKKTGNTYYHSASLLSKLILLLTDNVGRPHASAFAWSPNWFQTYVTCPREYAQSLILLRDSLPVAKFQACQNQLRDVVIVKFPDSTYKFWNGGFNTLVAAEVSINKGILSRNYSIIQNAYSFISSCLTYMLVDMVHNSGEGIKVDFGYELPLQRQIVS